MPKASLAREHHFGPAGALRPKVVPASYHAHGFDPAGAWPSRSSKPKVAPASEHYAHHFGPAAALRPKVAPAREHHEHHLAHPDL